MPASFAASLRTRLQALDPDARQVLAAAAVLGRRFDWDLLPGVAAVDGATVVGSLRRAVDAQLVTVDGQRFRFRHALTREAVLAELLPPERAELSGRALVAVQRAHPGLPGPWCELAAELAEGAGDRDSAAALTTESARRALARGALASAELTAERARSLAPPGSAAAAEAEEVLVTVLAHAGKPGPARALGHELLHRLDELGAPPARRVELLLVLVRAALAAGDAEAATADVRAPGRRAIPIPGTRRASTPSAHTSPWPTAGSTTPGGSRRPRSPPRADRPDVECEALEVLGRLRRRRPTRWRCSDGGADLAERHGLTTWRLRALQELALAEATPAGEPRCGRSAGWPRTPVRTSPSPRWTSSSPTWHWARFDHDACLEAAQRCVDASRRYGLASLPVALLWLAGAHALGGRETEMEAVLAEAAAAAPGDARVEADAWGRVRATYHALREDRAALRARTRPVDGVHPGRAGDGVGVPGPDAVGVAARAVRRRPRICPPAPRSRGPGSSRPGSATRPWHLVDAVCSAGRAAAGRGVRRRCERARDAVGDRDWSWYALRLTAEAAVRDGWGEPAGWLRETEAFFADRGYDRVARECRALLVAAGAPAIRRGRGRSTVPPALRRLGITSRELDVLALVADALPTREIAARLFLSPRTVEHHVASLLARTGSRSRTELAAFARANRVAADALTG